MRNKIILFDNRQHPTGFVDPVSVWTPNVILIGLMNEYTECECLSANDID